MKTAQQNTTHTLIPEAQLKLKKADRTKGDKMTSHAGREPLQNKEPYKAQQ